MGFHPVGINQILSPENNKEYIANVENWKNKSRLGAVTTLEYVTIVFSDSVYEAVTT